MAKQVIARQDGDDYQANFFWLKACGLNQSHTRIKKVAWEMDGTYGFDDVVVYYEPAIYESGGLVVEEYFQVKFHVDHDRGFTWEALMEPEFIGATKESLLQRLYKNYLKNPDKFGQSRYNIINTWQVDHSNDLKNLLNNIGGIRIDKLSQGGEKSKFGKIRKAWKDHLKISDDAELYKVLASLRLKHNYDDEQRLKENLNTSLALAGLKTIPADQRSSKYSDLIRKLHKDGQNIFTKEELTAICRNEELLEELQEANDQNFVIGVRSFQRGAESLNLEVHTIACLLHCFSGRFILEEHADMKFIKSELSRVATAAFESKKNIIVHLDTHLSIALLLGYNMDNKYGGLNISLVQKTMSGKLLWQPDPGKIRNYTSNQFLVNEIDFASKGSDVAITVNVTHDIRLEVHSYIQGKLEAVTKSLDFVIKPKVGSASIIDASHLIYAVEELISKIRSKTLGLPMTSRIHLFIAAPNALAFYLGQRIKPLGKITLYEYDFEKHRDGSYHPIISIP